MRLKCVFHINITLMMISVEMLIFFNFYKILLVMKNNQDNWSDCNGIAGVGL